MRSLFAIFFLIFSAEAFCQDNFSVFLIGDAGNDTSSNEVLALLKKELNKNSSSAVVFLGDNVYPNGFLEKKNGKHLLEKKRLLSQLSVVRDHKGSAFFIPGNHDWRTGKRNGKKAVSQACSFVNIWCAENTHLQNKATGVYLPSEGKGGPVSFLLSSKVRLILIDTQWWLQSFEADKFEKNLFLMQLDSILAISGANGERALLAGHHPLFTNGSHSKKRFLRFLVDYTPLKIFGLLGLDRLFTQDMPHPKYRTMREAFLKILEKHKGVIYAAGHDHNLQFFSPENTDDFFIVSGSGSKVTPLIGNKFRPVFSFDTGMGFFRIDFIDHGKFIVSAYTPVNGMLEKIYSAIF